MKYIAKKAVAMLFTLWVVSLLVFLAFAVIPGDPALVQLGTRATEEQLETLREEMGLHEPIWARYAKWLSGVLHGDFGDSYTYSEKVSSLILNKIPITLTLVGMAFLMILVVSVLVGIYQAKHENRAIGRLITIGNQVVMAIPSFFAGILITFFFGVVLHLFTPTGYVSYEKDVGAFLLYMIFPAIAIALPKIAMSVKLLSSSLEEEFGKSYVRTAYSKGNTGNGVLYQHMLRNALIPMVTFWGMVLADMIAGSIIIEQVFGIPGLGRVLLNSIARRDYPVVQGVILCVVFLVIMVNFLVDVLYRLIDPRTR